MEPVTFEQWKEWVKEQELKSVQLGCTIGSFVANRVDLIERYLDQITGFITAPIVLIDGAAQPACSRMFETEDLSELFDTYSRVYVLACFEYSVRSNRIIVRAVVFK